MDSVDSSELLLDSDEEISATATEQSAKRVMNFIVSLGDLMGRAVREPSGMLFLESYYICTRALSSIAL